MAISKLKFDSLLKISTASWAMWSDAFNKVGCTESKPENIEDFLKEHISNLKQNVILLGLNRSSRKDSKFRTDEKSSYPYANFHTTGHAGDGLLKSVVSKLTNISGAYMTDLSLDLQSDSTKVNIEQKKAFEYFINQLNILESMYFNIVCFGNKVFDTLKTLTTDQPIIIPNSDGIMYLHLNLSDRTLNCYKVIHYSYAVRYNHKDRFQRQMEIVNSKIGKLKT